MRCTSQTRRSLSAPRLWLWPPAATYRVSMVTVLQVMMSPQSTNNLPTYWDMISGTVVFLQPEQTLVFKVDVGWRYIVVCHYVFQKSPSSPKEFKPEHLHLFPAWMVCFCRFQNLLLHLFLFLSGRLWAFCLNLFLLAVGRRNSLWFLFYLQGLMKVLLIDIL